MTDLEPGDGTPRRARRARRIVRRAVVLALACALGTALAWMEVIPEEAVDPRERDEATEAFEELLDRDRDAALEQLADASAREARRLFEALGFEQFSAWTEGQRAIVLDAARRAFPDTIEDDAGWCGNAYGTPSNHSRVFRVLVSLDAAAEPVLEELLRDRDDVVRVNAAFVLREALASAPDRRLALLARAMDDDDPRVREVAAASLEEGCAKGGLEVLRAHLSDDDAFVRRRVAIAMASWGDPEAVPALIDAIGVTRCAWREDAVDCDDVLAYEKWWHDGVVEWLVSLTLEPEISPPPDGDVLPRDGDARDKAAWADWWKRNEATFDVRARMLAHVLRAPPPDRPFLPVRTVARLNDPEILEAIRVGAEWREDFGSWMAMERADLLDAEAIVRDPLQWSGSRTFQDAFAELRATRPELARQVVADVLISHDLHHVAVVGEAGLHEGWVTREDLLAALRREAESPDAAWTADVLTLLGREGTLEDCALIASVTASRLESWVARASKDLGCASEPRPAP